MKKTDSYHLNNSWQFLKYISIYYIKDNMLFVNNRYYKNTNYDKKKVNDYVCLCCSCWLPSFLLFLKRILILLEASLCKAFTAWGLSFISTLYHLEYSGHSIFLSLRYSFHRDLLVASSFHHSAQFSSSLGRYLGLNLAIKILSKSFWFFCWFF